MQSHAIYLRLNLQMAKAGKMSVEDLQKTWTLAL